MHFANNDPDRYEDKKKELELRKAFQIESAFLEAHQAACLLAKLKQKDVVAYKIYGLESIQQQLELIRPESFEQMQQVFAGAKQASKKNTDWIYSVTSQAKGAPESPESFQRKAVDAYLSILEDAERNLETGRRNNPPQIGTPANHLLHPAVLHISQAKHIMQSISRISGLAAA